MMLSFPLIIGHRGASLAAPENTLAAFSRALHDGADGVEFDVRLSRDQIPVVIHDDNLRRTGQVDRIVSELSAAQLQHSDVSRWFNERNAPGARFSETLPTLAQVFVLLKPTSAISYLEMKTDQHSALSLAERVVEEINAAQVSDNVIVSSFDLKAVELVKQIDAGIRTAALFEPKLSQPLSTLRRLRMVDLTLSYGADEIALHHSLASRRVIAAAQERGLGVVVWTVDDASWVRRANSIGITALITNQPGLLVRHRNSAKFQSSTNSAR